MEFRILGPLEVLDENGPVPLGTLKERVVLAVLLLHTNEVVSRERLIDELWGASPPPTAKKAVSVYLSKLRKTLARGGEDPITPAAGGYRIAVEPEQLDAARAQRFIADAAERTAAGDLDASAQLFRDALALWRGPTLAGITLESQGRDDVARLDELRLTALMDRIDCDLAQGGHERVLGELQVLVREHPLGERLRAQQMLALYRSDRQADALDAYQQARHVLVDDLGIDPSESLQRLQQAILRHDPALERPAGTTAVNGAASPSVVLEAAAPRRRVAARLRHRRLLTAAVAVAVAAVAAATALLADNGGGHKAAAMAPRPVLPNSLVRVDPATGTIVSDVATGIEPGPLAFSGDTAWVVNRGDRTISRYDVRSQSTTRPFAVGSDPYDVAADGAGNAWVSDRRPTVNWILHPASGTGTAAVPLGTKDIRVPLPGAAAEAYGAGYLWVISGPLTRRTGNDRVALIDVRTRKVSTTIRLGRQTTAIAYGYGSAWIGTYDRRHSTAWLSVVRAGSSRPESLRLETGDGWGPLAVAVGDGDVWVLTSAGTVLGIDPETQRVVHRVSLAAKQPVLLAVGAGSVWTANLAGYSLSEIAPRKNKVVRTVALGSYASVPCGLATTDDAVWVAIGDAYCDSVNRA
jgi:DNA-binding SARP family transcriptional activator/streptogramin lyase